MGNDEKIRKEEIEKEENNLIIDKVEVEEREQKGEKWQSKWLKRKHKERADQNKKENSRKEYIRRVQAYKRRSKIKRRSGIFHSLLQQHRVGGYPTHDSSIRSACQEATRHFLEFACSFLFLFLVFVDYFIFY